MGWMDFLAPAAALAATAATGGAAAPALVGTELAAAPALAAPLAGEVAGAAGAALAPATGVTAPTGFASILNPLGAADAAAANPFAIPGMASGPAPSMPMGMVPGPLPGAEGSLGLGTSPITPMGPDILGSAAGKNAAALKPEQLAQLSRLMPGQQGQAVGGGGGGGLKGNSGHVTAAAPLTAPALGTARPSLGAILGLRGAR